MSLSNIGLKTVVKGDLKAAIEKVTSSLKKQGFGVLTSIDISATLKSKINQDFLFGTLFGLCGKLSFKNPVGILSTKWAGQGEVLSILSHQDFFLTIREGGVNIFSNEFPTESPRVPQLTGVLHGACNSRYMIFRSKSGDEVIVVDLVKPQPFVGQFDTHKLFSEHSDLGITDIRIHKEEDVAIASFNMTALVFSVASAASIEEHFRLSKKFIINIGFIIVISHRSFSFCSTTTLHGSNNPTFSSAIKARWANPGLHAPKIT